MANDKKNVRNIAGTVWELIDPIAEELGYIIWDVEFVREGSEWYLRITIDSDEGISIDDCEKLHRAIDAPLDEADPIEQAYHLEVSSPGIERHIKYPWHFTVFVGEELNIKLYAPLPEAGNVKQIRATLTAYDEDEDILHLTLKDGKTVDIPREKTANVQAAFDF
ncbi:MAG: ribosome maturation factor RimP [Clostridia bacterium]|nr:ribosome maturation factor RimP [Clostridia bacterium]